MLSLKTFKNIKTQNKVNKLNYVLKCKGCKLNARLRPISKAKEINSFE